MNDNFLTNTENATNQFTFAQIKAGLRVSGQNCILHKRQISDVADNVYGIYAGNNTLNNTLHSNYNASDIYNKVYNTPPDVGAETIDLTNGLYNPTPAESEIRYNSDGKDLRVLFNLYQWRQINKFDLGYFEDSGYAYSLFEEDLQEGDILSMARRDGRQIRFVVIGLETLGNQLHMFHRFKLSNLGD